MQANGKIYLIGVGAAYSTGLPDIAREGNISVFGTKRFLENLPDMFPALAGLPVFPIAPVAEAINLIRDKLRGNETVIVLASGDPLFFGIGRRLIGAFGAEAITVYPAPTSLQYAFAHFKITWDDAYLLSLHGREDRNYLGKILARKKTAILTDRHNSPEVIAQELSAFLGDDEGKVKMHVAENIGGAGERYVAGTPAEVACETFGSLCCVLVEVENDSGQADPRFGLHEPDICHSRGLITKAEVRATALHLLNIPDNSILWDVGAGSGSVGLEAARMVPDILVYAIEKKEEQHANILDNRQKFSRRNIKLIKGEAPGALQELPVPDRVFIGGSGGNLSDIIDFCSEKLVEGGKLVVTAVLEKTSREAPAFMHEAGLQVTTHKIMVERGVYPAEETITLNPITIIVGTKPRDKEISSD